MRYGSPEVGISVPRTLLTNVSQEKSESPTKLERLLQLLSIQPIRVVRATERLARSRGYERVSERHLRRLRDGSEEPTRPKIRSIVAALRLITGLGIRASDAFDVEPDRAELSLRNLIGHPDPSRSQTLGLSVFWIPRPRPGRRAHWMPIELDTLEMLYRQLGPLMLLVAERRWQVPRPDAEALVHDVFASFLEREPQVDDVQAYLVGATRHACQHYWRKRKHESPMPDDLADGRESERQERWELRLTMMQALADSGPRCREVLRRFYVDKEPVQTLAASLGVAPASVYQILYECRNRLRRVVYGPTKRSA